MGKVILVCGKICSGKSYYSKTIKEPLNGVIISPDEATYDLINNEQGEFYNVFSARLNKYLTKKVGEIAQAGANVIFERGLWSHTERKEVKDYYKNNGMPFLKNKPVFRWQLTWAASMSPRWMPRSQSYLLT